MTAVQPSSVTPPAQTQQGVTGLESSGFCAPRYDDKSLSAVLPAAAGSMGYDLTVTGGLNSLSARHALQLPAVDRVCVVLVDGLGSNLLTDRAGHAPALRRLQSQTRELTVGFPSTTSASMGSFGTGTTPGLTGMLGYTIRNAETDALANMVSWAGMSEPSVVQRERTMFERLVSAGAEVTSVGPKRFADSGMTRAALRGARYVGVESLADRVDATAYELTAPGLVYLYWGDVDKIGHRHGSASHQWGEALSDFDAEFGRLLKSLPRNTLVLVTADHGMVDVDPALQWDIAAESELSRGIRMVAGEPRATHLYLESDARVEDVLQRWRNRLGSHAVALERSEAISRGWFGPVAPHVSESIPDIVVAATGRATIVDSASQTPGSIALKGVHGSLTPNEMLVPLVVELV